MVLFRVTLVLGILVFVAPRIAVGQQVAEDYSQRLGRIEQELNIVQQSLRQTDGESGGPAFARLNFRISELEQELRTTTGKLEDLNFRMRQLESRLQKLDSDVAFRLRGLETSAQPSHSDPSAASAIPETASVGHDDPASSSVTGRGPTVLGQIPKSEVDKRDPSSPDISARSANQGEQTGMELPEGTPREQYAYAFNLLRKADYSAAEIAFAEFLTRYPNDALSPNARYWLGETYYVRGDYAQAAEVFLDGYQSSKTGPKAPDTLLKLGMSLANLNKTREACATFSELNQKLPDASAVIKQKAEDEQKRLGCR